MTYRITSRTEKAGNRLVVMPEFCRSCRSFAAPAAISRHERQDHGRGVLWCCSGFGAEDLPGVGRCGWWDVGFRRIWRFGWKWNLEQTCRWSGKTPARLVFEQVQKVV